VRSGAELVSSCWAILLTVVVPCACSDEPEPGFLVELRAPRDPARRPEFIWAYWLSPRGVLLEGRLPENGALPARGPILSTLFISTEGPLQEARAVVVRGQRGQEVVAGGLLRIEPGAPRRSTGLLQLDRPLPDEDRDGVPDAVEENCLALQARLPCLPPVQLGTSAIDAAADLAPAPPDMGSLPRSP
jgi:hypothetical protein